MTHLDDRFAALEATLTSQQAALEAQQAEIALLRDQLAPTAHESDEAVEPTAATHGSGRSTPRSRRMLLKSGAAAGAAVAAATLAPRSVAAADGANMLIGRRNESDSGNTFLIGSGIGQYSDQNVLTVSDQSATSAFPAAIGAYGQDDRVNNGLYAFTGGRNDADTNTGYAIVATSQGGRSNLLLVPSSGNPHSDTFAHRRGAVRSDTSGNLWFCTDSGTPGVWRRLAGPKSAGAVHAITPARVYDSRFVDGALGGGSNRQIFAGNAIDVVSGDVTMFNVVPSGATAVFFTVTITGTVGEGFALVAPGSATSVTGSSINWTSAGQTAANGSFSTLDDSRNLRVFAGGGSTEFIIDITGYTA